MEGQKELRALRTGVKEERDRVKESIEEEKK